MLNLLDKPTFDNERNILNADLFVSNLKNTLKGFELNPKVTYEVYRKTTVYHISWTDDKTCEDVLSLKKEIALALGIREMELNIKKDGNNKIQIIVPNMKQVPLTLKELLTDFKKSDHLILPLGLDEYDHLVTLDLEKEKSLLVTGVSGTGKTNLFNSLIMSTLIEYQDTKIIILDSQSINYNTYSSVAEVINDEDKIIARIKSLRHEFEKRVKNGHNNRIIVFIDEIYEILKNDISVKDDINYLLELGSMMNIHLIVSTDSIVENDILDLFNRDNVSKLTFYLTSRGQYHMFLGKVINTELNNDSIYLNTDNEMNKISIPLISDDEIERVVNNIKK